MNKRNLAEEIVVQYALYHPSSDVAVAMQERQLGLFYYGFITL